MVFRVDIDQGSHSQEDKAREDVKVEAIRRELDHWAGSIPEAAPATQDQARWMYEPESSTGSDSCNYFTLQYHKAILSLYTNVLPTYPWTITGSLLARNQRREYVRHTNASIS